MKYLGDFADDSTVDVYFDTYDAAGASITMTDFVIADVIMYKNGSVTQRTSTAGVTLFDTDGIDFDGQVGLHGFSIDLSDNTDSGFWATGNNYMVWVDAVTIDGNTVGFVACTFSIENRLMRGTDSAALASGVQVSGIDASTITATSIATDAITAAKIAANAITSSEIANGAIHSGALGTNSITAASIEAGAIGSSEIAADAIGASELAADAIDEIAQAVWDLDATAHQTAGTFGIAIGDPLAGSSLHAKVDGLNDIDGSSVTVTSMGANTITAASIATDAGDEIAAAVWADSTRTLTASTNFNDLSAAEVNTEVDNAMVTYGLDHLVFTSVTGTDVANNSIFARLVSDAATADWDTFDHTTDSLEALQVDHVATDGLITGLNDIDGSSVTVTSIGSSVITAASIAANAIGSSELATDAIGSAQIAANAIGSSEIAANAIGASELATDAVDEIAAGVWADSTRTLTASDNFNDLSAAEVNTEVDNAMVTYGLDHLVSASVTGTDITNNSIIAHLVSSSATADWDTYDNETDSLQAISDGESTAPTADTVAQAVWDLDATAHQTLGTFGRALGDPLASTSILARVDALNDISTGDVATELATYDGPTKAELDSGFAGQNDLSAAQVNTEVDNALVTYGLDHLVFAAVVGADVTDNSIIAHLVSKSATADWDSYDNETDSLEAISDGESTAPTADTVAQAVWDLDATAHQTLGTFGRALGDPLASTSILARVDALNDISTGDVATELATYDGPTKAELDSGFAGLNDIDGSSVTVTSIGANVVNASALATDAVDEIAAGVWADTTRTLTASTNFNDLSAAEVNTEVDNAMVTYGLDHLVQTSVVGADITDNSIIAHLVSSSATADWDTYDNETDSLQAISDGESTAPTAAAVADAVWDRDATSNQDAGSFGIALGDPLAGGSLHTKVDALNDISTGDVATELATYDAPTKAELDSGFAALNDLSFADIWQTQLTESYNTDGVAPTAEEAVFVVMQRLLDFAISGTTISVKGLDGTTEKLTLTLNDATNPSSSARAT